MNRYHGHPDITWFRAVGTMIGGVVGVGVFGLPFAFAQSGWCLGLLILLALGGLLLVLNLMYAEINIQTPGKHRLVGLVKKYLGSGWSHFATAIFIPYSWGAMLAYMLVGGDFLYALLSPLFGGPIIIYQVAIALLAAALTFGGVKKLAKMEFGVILALLFLFVFIILVSLPSLTWQNISPLHFSNWFVPYGVIFFAMSGLGVIPEMKEVLGNRHKKDLPHTVLVGQVLIFILYALFTLAVVGVTGAATTEAAFDGLATKFGPIFAVAGSLLGAITVVSIFSIVSIEMQDIWRFDYKLSQKKSWALAAFVPIIILFFGFNKFVDLIGFLGAVFGGVIGILVVIMYQKMRRDCPNLAHCSMKVPQVVVWLLVAVFAGGIIQTVLGLE